MVQKYKDISCALILINNTFLEKHSSLVGKGMVFAVLLVVKKRIAMKKTLILALLVLLSLPIVAQSKDKKPGLNKENCTFVTKDGKTFNLYGKVKIVESFPDIKVQIVESFEDLDVKIVENFPDQCGKIKLVENFPDVKVQIVNSFPDIKVKIVESFPGVRR